MTREKLVHIIGRVSSLPRGLSRGCDWSIGHFFEFLITDDHSEVPTFVSNLL